MVISCNGEASIYSEYGEVYQEQLQNNHEEADTAIIIHMKQLLTTYNRFIIKSDDTDVLVLLIRMYSYC